MRNARIVRLLAVAGCMGWLAAHAAEGDPKPPQAPAAQPPGTKPPNADQTDYSKEQERAVKPPTDASMGAAQPKPEPSEEPGRKK